MLARQRNASTLDLGVAVRTQEDALARLGACPLERTIEAVGAESELLERRIAMMKLERPDVAVIAADRAYDAGLANQDCLYLAPPPGHSLSATPQALEITL
jgi:hypothetical protein